MIFWLNKKSASLWSSFVISEKKKIILGVTNGGPSFAQVMPKNSKF